jgi:hypothetical protein
MMLFFYSLLYPVDHDYDDASEKLKYIVAV